jgi:hypothetical protein
VGILEESALGASAVRADEGALASVALPDRAFHRRRNVAAARGARLFGSRPIDGGVLRLAQLRE